MSVPIPVPIPISHLVDKLPNCTIVKSIHPHSDNDYRTIITDATNVKLLKTSVVCPNGFGVLF